jgi:hypothetical protein
VRVGTISYCGVSKTPYVNLLTLSEGRGGHSRSECPMNPRGTAGCDARLLKGQAFVCLGHDLIDHRFHVLGAFPHHKLPVRTGPFVHDSLDVLNLGLVAQLLYFRRNKLEHLVE